jgi:hypothetical protein
MKYLRNCPICGCDIIYSYEGTLNNAIKKNSLCKSCRGTQNFNKMHSKMKNGEIPYGFKSKKHSESTKNKMSKSITQLFKEGKLNASGENNGMYGKNIPYKHKGHTYEEIVGEEKAKKWKDKISKTSSGENNGMYGKPSPNGSGNGWSGWYKNWYFRSLLELSYMINVIERFKLEWKSAESKEYMIKYVSYDGKIKNYFPDFIISNKYLVECKPKKLWNSKLVNLKKEAALIYCKKHNLIYKLVDIKKLDKENVEKLYKNGDIIFNERFKNKLKQYDFYV